MRPAMALYSYSTNDLQLLAGLSIHLHRGLGITNTLIALRVSRGQINHLSRPARLRQEVINVCGFYGLTTIELSRYEFILH